MMMKETVPTSKREATSPPELSQDAKIQKHTVTDQHTSHESVLNAADLLTTTPVSRKDNPLLTGKTLVNKCLEMNLHGEGSPPGQDGNYKTILSLCTDLEMRVSAVESELKTVKRELHKKTLELSEVRSENAALQSQISCTGAGESSVQSSESSTEASSGAPVPVSVQSSESSESLTHDSSDAPGSVQSSERSTVAPSGASVSASSSPGVPMITESSNSSEGLATLHPADIVRSQRLSLILNTLKNLPDHVNTVIFGDSNTHKIRGRDVDSKGNKVAVRSFSGLCVFAAAHALEMYDKPAFGKIRKVIWSLGANDALHGNVQHCAEDAEHHTKALYQQSKRIFPNAQIGFILPFVGIKAVTADFRKELERQLKATPEMKLHYPPNMVKMMLRDGVHINSEGKRAYANFLTKRFTNNKPSTSAAPSGVTPTPQDTQRGPATQLNTSVSGFQNQNSWGSFRLPPPAVPPYPPNEESPAGCRPNQQSLPDFSELARGITDVVHRTMQCWSLQQLRLQNGRSPQWPPL